MNGSATDASPKAPKNAETRLPRYVLFLILFQQVQVFCDWVIGLLYFGY